MYFFLQHLAFVDLRYTSAITPKMWQNFVGTENSSSFIGCMEQLLVHGFCNKRLLYPFSYGSRRICGYLSSTRYPTLMSQRVCIQFLVGSYVMGFLNASVNVSSIFSLNFRQSNKINHFSCDEPPILALSCSNTDLNIMLIMVFVGINLTFTVLVVIFSYTYILAAILRRSSAAGKRKASSTRASHLTAVIFYGTRSYMYLHQGTNESQEQEKMVSVFYGVMIPMSNPLIYSLRNQDMIEALKRMGKKCF